MGAQDMGGSNGQAGDYVDADFKEVDEDGQK